MKRSILTILILFCISQTFALQGAKYLIIAPDNFVQALKPLADWKTKKGVKAMVVPLSVTGNSATQIKSYIVNAYNNWEIRPEYILLAGFGSVLPVSGTSDDYYADITGSYQIELSIGRLPCSNVSQCNMLVAKILGYERTPYLTDSVWYRKGTTIIREDNPPDAYYQSDCRYIRNLMLTHSFVHTDSFISTAGNTSTDVMNAINNGRSYVVYRGPATVNWNTPFNQVIPNNLTNGFKFPVVISGTCATVSMTTNDYLADKFLLAGTTQNPKGAVAFFGTTIATHFISQYRSLVTKGFFQALFLENKFKLGDATKRAKFIMDSTYSNQDRYLEWNLLGDPELNLWTATPRALTIIHDTIINNIQQSYAISVTCNNIPVAGALVCLMKDSTVYQYDYTDNSGAVSFNIYPYSPGIMSVTVTAKNCIPYEKNVSVIPANLSHNVGVLSIIEPVGTIASDSNIIPKAIIKNFGLNIDTFPVTFVIDSSYIQTVTSVVINPGDSTTVSFPLWVSILGNHTVIVFTSLANDQWRGNDTAFSSVNVILLNDVGVDSILSPSDIHFINSIIVPQVKIKNYGALSQTNFPVVCSIISSNGMLRYIDSSVISLATERETIIDFSNWIPTIAGLYVVKIRTNNVYDMNPFNDCKTKITVISNSKQDTIGTNTTNSYLTPICRSYNYSTHEVIYLQSELNTEGTIAKIAYFKDHGNNTVSIENVKIYMKHTTATTLTSGYYSLTGYTEVFDGTFPNNDISGWMEVELTTPFAYNNTDNLQILILKGFQPYLSGYPYWRYTTTTPNYRCRYAYDDNRQPTLLTQSYNRPNVMLTMALSPSITTDIGVLSITNPNSIHPLNSVMAPQVRIKNYGTSTQTNFAITCSIVNQNGLLRFCDTQTVAMLASHDTISVNFCSWTPVITELCTVKVRTLLENDSNPLNNQQFITTQIMTVSNQDFELDNGEYIAEPSTSAWDWGVPTSGPGNAHSGTKVWATVLNGNYAINANWKLTSSNFIAAINNPTLRFWHWYYMQSYDGGNVKISTNNGVTWTLLHPINGYNYVTSTSNVGIPGESCYAGISSGWTDAAFILPVVSGQRFLIRWCFGSNNTGVYAGWYIDDVTGEGFSALDNDIGVRCIIYPLTLLRVNTTFIPVACVKNCGSVNQRNIPVICSIIGNNGSTVTRYIDSLYIPLLIPNETTRIAFRPCSTIVSETCVTVIQTNLNNDENPSNNRKTKMSIISLSYLVENFTDTIFPVSGWTIYNFDQGLYSWSRFYGNPYSPPASAVCRVDTGTIISNDWLIAPRIGQVRTNDSLIFYYRANSTAGYDSLLARLSTSANISDTAQYSILDLISTNSQSYIRKAIDLSAYSGNMVYIAFQYRCHQLRIFIDDIIVRGYDPEGITTDKTYSIPFITMLFPSTPNPVKNSITRISFSLAEPSKVSLRIFDISGRIIKTLADNQMNIGMYHYNWNLKDEHSKPVAQGIYFYTLETAKQKFTKKMIVLN